LACQVSAANRHDVTALLPLVAALKPIAGRRGHPRRYPDRLQADQAYDSREHMLILWWLGMEPVIARRGRPHGSGLGKTRWVIERTLGWIRQYRRLRIRYEKRRDIHQAFLELACILLCYKRLIR
jgi:transposase